MGIEVVTVSAGGMNYTAFKKVSVGAAFNEAARSFSFEVAAELGASATNSIFAVGTEITITANGDLLLSGHVDEREPRLKATEAQITVSGRSKSADLIDGSAEHDTGHFKKDRRRSVTRSARSTAPSSGPTSSWRRSISIS